MHGFEATYLISKMVYINVYVSLIPAMMMVMMIIIIIIIIIVIIIVIIFTKCHPKTEFKNTNVRILKQ